MIHADKHRKILIIPIKYLKALNAENPPFQNAKGGYIISGITIFNIIIQERRRKRFAYAIVFSGIFSYCLIHQNSLIPDAYPSIT